MRILGFIVVAFLLVLNKGAGAAPEEKMEWSWAQGPAEQGGNSPTAFLQYSIPETDAVAFEASCGGPAGSAARAVFGYDTRDFNEGQAVNLAVSGDGFASELAGKVYGKGLEVGLSGIQVDIAMEAPVWRAMSNGTALTYRVSGAAPATLQLDGAAAPIRAFRAACRQTVAAAIPEAQAAPATSRMFLCNDGATVTITVLSDDAIRAEGMRGANTLTLRQSKTEKWYFLNGDYSVRISPDQSRAEIGIPDWGIDKCVAEGAPREFPPSGDSNTSVRQPDDVALAEGNATEAPSASGSPFPHAAQSWGGFVRSSPRREHKKIAKLKEGEKITILSQISAAALPEPSLVQDPISRPHRVPLGRHHLPQRQDRSRNLQGLQLSEARTMRY